MKSIDDMGELIRNNKLGRQQKIRLVLATISKFMTTVLRIGKADARDCVMAMKAVFYIGEACGSKAEKVLELMCKEDSEN